MRARGRHRLWRPRPHARDTRADDERVRVREEMARMRERITPDGLNRPQDAVAKPLDRAREVDGRGRVELVEEREDPEVRKLHGARLPRRRRDTTVAASVPPLGPYMA